MTRGPSLGSSLSPISKRRSLREDPGITPHERAALVRAVHAVSLLRIELSEVRSERSGDEFDQLVAPRPASADGADTTKVDLDVEVAHRHAFKDGRLVVQVRFELKTKPETLKTDAIFTLRYKVAGRLSKAEANAFARHNAVFNAWPYWRELVQSQAVRMGLPPLTVPLLKA